MATKSSRPQDLQEKAEGPQVLLSKSHLYMENYSGTPASNDLIVTNTGTSAVFYEWKKYPRSDSIKSKRPDIVTRFYCHYSKGMLLPGESKRFLFTFISKKVGIFTEAWDLHTDPLVVKAIPQLILTGRAFEPDKMIAQRYFFEQEFNKRIVLHTAEEILTDVVRSVRTPTPPPPDLSNSKECQEQFESKNLSDQVWHTDEIILLFRELEQEVRSHLAPSDQPEIQDPWDLKLENLRKLINKLSKPELREDKQKRLNFLIKLSKAKPPTRSLYWPEARKVLVDLTEAVPGISSGLRTELDLEDYRFRLPWELTQEELDKIQKEKNDKEAARAKLAKGKKGKTEDDIGKDRETYKEKLFQLTKHSLIDLLCRGIDEERFIVQWNHLETIQKTKDLPKVLQNTNRLNKHMKNSNIANYELARNKIAPLNTVNLGSLSRKFGLADADLEGKKVMIRVNFNVPLSEEVWETEEVDVQTDPDLEPIMVHEKHCLLREVVDSRALMEVVPTIRYCLDHLAKCVVIVGTLGPNVGEIREEFSLMPILNFLQEELDNEIQFFEDVDIDNFEEKIEDLPENSIILIENLAFHPCEIGISASRDGVVKHVDLDKIRQYREKLCTYCDIFINEAFDDKHMRNLGNDSCSNVNPGCSSLNFLECGCEGVMGLKLEKEIKVLSSTFFEPEHPFVAMIGGNSQSKLSHLDKLVMSYAFLDVVDVLFIAGDLSQIIQSVQNGHSGHDARLDRFVKLFLNQVQESKKKLILPEDFIYSKEPLVPSESSFSWGHFASLVVPASNDEISAENLKIVGFGEKTREKLEVLLGQSRRFFWCGSLDLHFSDRSEIVPLNKTAVEFFKAHKETKELFVTIQDVESSLLPFFEKEEGRSPEKIEENEGFEEEEQSKSEESAQGESMIVPADNSPEENLEKFFSNRLGLYQFVVDILQAKKVRPVELIKEHPPPKPKSVEEDTSYLEII